MAKILLSKSEWRALKDYINFVMTTPYPCDGCQDSGHCCGCSKETIYQNKIKEIGASELMEIKDVQLYVELSIKYAKVQEELVKAQEMVKKVSTELATVTAKFIEEQKKDFYAIREDTVEVNQEKDDFHKKKVSPRRIKFSCPGCKYDFEIPFYMVKMITPNCYRHDCPLCNRTCLHIEK